MPAVVEWKGMRHSIRYLNILFQPSNFGRKPQVICHDPLCSTALLCEAGSCIWFLLKGVQYLTGVSYRKSSLALRCEEITTSQKLPHPWDFD